MKKTLSILLALVMIMTIAVPGITAAEAADEQIAGGYRLTGVASDEGSDLEIISKVIGFGVNLYLFLQEDGTGSIQIMGTEIPLSWTDGKLIIPPYEKYEDTITLPFTCVDGVLKIQTSAFAMNFTALTDAEQKEYEENGAGSLLGVAGMLVMSLLDKLDGDLVTSLLFSLGGGSIFDVEFVPIPDGEPSEGPVTGIVGNIEYTILGAEHVLDEMAGDVIVFYFDAKNLADHMDGSWRQNHDAGQDGEFLDQVFHIENIPELSYASLEMVPGATVRCAAAYPFDPAGGTVGFRICDYGDEDNGIIYYADPQNPSGAPEAFVFDASFTVPEEWKALPEETEDLRIESAELAKDEDGGTVLKYVYHQLSDLEAMYPYYFCQVIQDGVELEWSWDEEAGANSDEGFFAKTCYIRTDSPAYIIGFQALEGGEDVAVTCKIVEVN